MLHLFYILFFIELVFAVCAYTNVAEYAFMPVKERSVNYLSEMRLKLYLVLSIGVIFFFHAFKNPLTLVDIPEYVDAFYEAKNLSWETIYEIGYESFKTETGFAFIIKAVSSLFSNDQVLFFLTSAFLLSAVYFAIRRYSPIWWASVFIFMTDSFPQSLFILRSFIGIGIFLYAFPSILNRKIVVFLLLCFLASTIHMSAIIILPVYFLYGIKDWRYLTLSLVITAGILILGFMVLLPLIVEAVLPEYAYYMMDVDNSEGISWKMPALLTAILLFRLYVMKEHFLEEGINRLLSIIMILAVTIYVAGMDFGMTSRIAMFYANMTFLILPNTLQYIKSSSWQFVCAIAYILLNSFFFLKSASDFYWVNYQLLEI